MVKLEKHCLRKLSYATALFTKSSKKILKGEFLSYPRMQEMTQQRHSSEKKGRDRERIERKEYNSLRSESESEKAAEKKRL